jgi:hypothetical protein
VMFRKADLVLLATPDHPVTVSCMVIGWPATARPREPASRRPS